MPLVCQCQLLSHEQQSDCCALRHGSAQQSDCCALRHGSNAMSGDDTFVLSSACLTSDLGPMRDPSQHTRKLGTHSQVLRLNHRGSNPSCRQWKLIASMSGAWCELVQYAGIGARGPTQPSLSCC